MKRLLWITALAIAACGETSAPAPPLASGFWVFTFSDVSWSEESPIERCDDFELEFRITTDEGGVRFTGQQRGVAGPVCRERDGEQRTLLLVPHVIEDGQIANGRATFELLPTLVDLAGVTGFSSVVDARYDGTFSATSVALRSIEYGEFSARMTSRKEDAVLWRAD